ncbi:hypothetical protein ACFYXL_05805 [Streptomyces tsukubensis]|uniref:hypothetical protein n=1 Tax=Streptomyces tsukubensis TaxID=83656 RepID=UPI00368CAF33
MPEPSLATLLADLRNSLDVLLTWESYPWPDVALIARRVGPLTLDALTAHGVWDQLTPHDQAAAHWTMADSRRIHQKWTPGEDPAAYGKVLARFAAEAAYFALRCAPTQADRWPETTPARTALGRSTVFLWRAYEGLSGPWQACVLRQLAAPERAPVLLGRSPEPEPERPTLNAALALAAAKSERGKEPPAGPRSDQRTGGSAELVSRLARLPEGWRVEALRRIAEGDDPAHVVSDAAQGINLLRSDGILVGWNAPDSLTG